MILFYLLIFIVIAMPIAALIAWNLPRSFRILLVSLASCTFLIVPIALWLRYYYVPDYLYTPYMRHANVISYLLMDTLLVSTGLPGAWLRQGRRISRDQIVALLIALTAAAVWSHQPSYPTAKALRANFVEHRTTFERLAMMACEDMPSDANSFVEGIRGWSPGVTRFLPVRLATYRQLLHDVGVTPPDVDAQGNLSLLFLNYQMASGNGGGARGYVYSCTAIAMKPLVPSLDVPGPIGQMRYQALAPHWYLRDYNLGPDAL